MSKCYCCGSESGHSVNCPLRAARQAYEEECRNSDTLREQLEQVTKDLERAKAKWYDANQEAITLTKSLEVAKGYLKQHADMGCQLAVDKLADIAALESKPSPDAGRV